MREYIRQNEKLKAENEHLSDVIRSQNELLAEKDELIAQLQHDLQRRNDPNSLEFPADLENVDVKPMIGPDLLFDQFPGV